MRNTRPDRQGLPPPRRHRGQRHVKGPRSVPVSVRCSGARGMRPAGAGSRVARSGDRATTGEGWKEVPLADETPKVQAARCFARKLAITPTRKKCARIVPGW